MATFALLKKPTVAPLKAKTAAVKARTVPAARPNRKLGAPDVGSWRESAPDLADRAARLQLKALLTSPGDPLELEADRTAERVVGMAEPTAGHLSKTPDAAVQRKCASCTKGTAKSTSDCPNCAAETTSNTKVFSKAAAHSSPLPGPVSSAPPGVGAAIRVARRPGEPLSLTERRFFEPRFDTSFDHVRVHTDEPAARAALGIGARAFTVENNVVFGRGEYAPATNAGRLLLAHELTHVVQQVPGVARRKDDPAENIDGRAEYKDRVYRIWGTYREGDTPEIFWLRCITTWIPWRFGPVSPALREQMLQVLEDKQKTFLKVRLPDGVPGQRYFWAIDIGLVNALDRMVQKERTANETNDKRQAKDKDKDKQNTAAENAPAPSTSAPAGPPPPSDVQAADTGTTNIGDADVSADGRQEIQQIDPLKVTAHGPTPEEQQQHATEAKALIDRFTKLLNLDEDGLGAELKDRALKGDFDLVKAVFDELGYFNRDDVAEAFMSSILDADLERLAKDDRGRRLLDRLLDELTQGSVSEGESAQADRIVRVKSAQISPEAFNPDAAKHVKIFPFKLPGLTVLDDAPISAERAEGGRIRVKQPVRVLGTDAFAADVATLPISVFTSGVQLPENEIVGVRAYDLGGVVIYRPAIYLVQISNQNDTAILEKIAETAGYAATLGAGGLLAGAARGAGLVAQALVWADRAALVLAVLTSVLREHRGFFIERFGDSGKEFVRDVDLVSSAVAIYGMGRLVMGGVQLLRQLGTAYRNMRAVASAVEGTLSAGERQALQQAGTSTEELLADAERLSAEQAAAAKTPAVGAGAPGPAPVEAVPAAPAEAAPVAGAEPAPAKKPPSSGEPVPAADERLRTGAGIPEGDVKALARGSTVDGAHDLSITPGGDLIRCSPICTRLRIEFAKQIAADGKLEAELASIEGRAKSAASSKDATAARAALDDAIAIENRLANADFDKLRAAFPKLTPEHVAAVRARGVDAATLEGLLRAGTPKALTADEAVLIAETGGLRGAKEATRALNAPGGTVNDALDAATAAEGQQPGIRPPKSVKRFEERELPFKATTVDGAYASALDDARVQSGLGANEIPFRQELGPQAGRISGRIAPDGSHGWRLDWDGKSTKQFHINWWRTDATGFHQGANVVVGGTYDTYLAMLNALGGGR